MKTYKDLEKGFNKKVKELQKICKHEEVSDWMQQHWAIGHPTCFQVKICKTCNKIVAKKTNCYICGKETEDFIEGDGTDKFPMGVFYCRKCKK